MTRTVRTARKTLELKVRGMRVIVRATKGKRAVKYARTFRNRYALRKFLTGKLTDAKAAGYSDAR